jgi:hypothetical protein
LFNTAEKHKEGDAEDNLIDKLKKDLVFMWRSELYSDVRIEIQGKPSPGAPEEETTAAFSSRRFVLMSRSPYFFDQLVTYGGKTAIGEVPTFRLPTPPFTLPYLHFILGFLYTVTLNFSNHHMTSTPPFTSCAAQPTFNCSHYTTRSRRALCRR